MGRAERINRILEGDKRMIKSPKKRAQEFWLSGYTRMMLCEEITRLQDKCGEVNPPDVVGVKAGKIDNDFSMKSDLEDDLAMEYVKGPQDQDEVTEVNETSSLAERVG